MDMRPLNALERRFLEGNLDMSHDQNRVATLIAALNTDGITPVEVKVNATNNALKVNDGTTGSDNGRTIAVRDGNYTPVLLAVSEVDGVTPVEVYANSSGALLIDST